MHGLPPTAALLLFLSAMALRQAASAAAPTWWKPKRYNSNKSLLSFQYQLSDEGSIRYVPGVQVYAIDFDTAETAIPLLKKRNSTVRVICYFSAGSWEEYRVDEDQSKRGIKPTDWGTSLGKPLDNWPGERWVDVRRPEVRRIMKKRLQYAKRIGCDGVDPDNVNGHENDTGFKLTKRDLVLFNIFLANNSHALGLGIGLKNGLDMIPQLHPYFEWAINEECNVFGECDAYKAFAASKPIFGVEYCDAQESLGVDTLDPACFCPRMLKAGYSFIYKRVVLSAPGFSCTKYCGKYPTKCAAARPSGSCKAPKSNMCGGVGSASDL